MNLWKNRNFGPMLLKEIDKPFDSNDYSFEIKFDGIRALIFVKKDKIQIISRNNKDITSLYPELEKIKLLVTKDTILDGEIVVMDKGKSSFEKLSKRSHLKGKNKILLASKENPVVYVAFDILYYGKSIVDMSLIERKDILNKINDNDVLIKSKVFNNYGIKLFKSIKEKHLEGIVAKKNDSIYEVNSRSSNWIKIKNFRIGTFFIGGFKIMKNNYLSAQVGELKNNKLYYVGSVSVTSNLPLYQKLKNSSLTKASPFIDYEEKSCFLKKLIKCQIKYMEKTSANHLRQPVIKR